MAIRLDDDRRPVAGEAWGGGHSRRDHGDGRQGCAGSARRRDPVMTGSAIAGGTPMAAAAASPTVDVVVGEWGRTRCGSSGPRETADAVGPCGPCMS
ncbi:hypothetical protein ZWY2020_048274 [Hordeum vulgare]|nr:hypothetical protein ZWY2020_048274 [Hordeum vulgare]